MTERVGKQVKVKTTAHGATVAKLADVQPGDYTKRKSLKLTPEFIESIRARGVVNPIQVCWGGGGRKKAFLEAVDGHRRYAAAREAGLKEIRVFHNGYLTEEEKIVLALTANEGQEPLTKSERMDGITDLLAIGHTKEEAAATIGVSLEYVANALRIEKNASSKMKAAAKKSVKKGGVDRRVAARASKLPEEDQDELLEEVAGKPRNEALKKVEEAEAKAGVSSPGPRMSTPSRASKAPSKPKCKFKLLSNADELCEAMEKRIRNRLSHNSVDREANAQLQVLEVLKGNATIADVFGWG